MKKTILLLSILLGINSGFSQTIQWQKCLGGSNNELGGVFQRTTDGGYIIAGGSYSNDGDVTDNHGLRDYWIVKTDSSGAIQWQKSYGGSGEDGAMSVKQTTDGGYIVAGWSNSTDGDVTGNHGDYDYWVLKLGPSGEIEWQKSLGGSSYEEPRDVQQTSDGGYIITGSSMSNNGDVTGNHGNQDCWVVKLFPSGGIEWQKSYGGSENDKGSMIQKLADGGYIIASCSASDDGNVSGQHGGGDYWIIKINSTGIIQWEKCFGGSNTDYARSISQTTEGGFIIAGESYSDDGDLTGNHGGTDYWIVKINSEGEIQWQKNLGGALFDWAYNVRQTNDGGYIIIGYSESFDGDVTGNHGSNDYWAVKLDGSGTTEWKKCFGGWDNDLGFDIEETIDSGFIMMGYANSQWGDVTGNHGGADYWLVKICFSDPLSVSLSDSVYCFHTTLSATEGFASYLWNTGDTTQSIDVDTGGVYTVVATNATGCPSESAISVPGPVQPYGGEQICMVTLDEETSRNLIVVEKTIGVGTDSILFYRMNDQTSQFNKIGSIGIDDPGLFTDDGSVPAQQSYQYKISVKDTCGWESDLSNVHRTILLQANTGINKEINLFWNGYEGFEYPNFEIYRSNGESGFVLLANVPNNTYTYIDLTPPSGTNRYQVRVTKGTSCNVGKSVYGYVASNIFKISSDVPNLDVAPVNRNVSSAAGSTFFVVTSDTNWTVSSEAMWCSMTSAGSGNDSVFVYFSENTTGSPRVAVISVVLPAQPSIFKNMTVSQSNLSDITEVADNAIRIYPNPVRKKLVIETPSEMKNVFISISDIEGRLLRLLSQNVGKTQIDIGDLQKGLYIIKIQTGSFIAIKKIIKE